MKPCELYLQKLHAKEISVDNKQQAILPYLDAIHASANKPFLARFKDFFGFSHNTQGLYLWGGVGGGKTFLVDLLFKSLEPSKVQRFHFHRFMLKVHLALKQAQGHKNPMQVIARQFAITKIIILDEFYVSDIADAMLLAQLLAELFKLNIILVATSNIAPEHLYQNGLQRDKFLPTIDLLNKNCKIIALQATTDYRLRTLEQIALFHVPAGKQANNNLRTYFYKLAKEPPITDGTIEVLGRQLKPILLAQNIIWFDFESLCATARSQNDYIELARIYQTIIVSDVPQLTDANLAAVRRFIALIDELYERKIKLLLSLDYPLTQLFASSQLEFASKRTLSRLHEMQTREYLSLAHLV